MVVGVLGLVYRTCDYREQKCETLTIKQPTVVVTPPLTEQLPLNYTTTANCSHGLSLGNLIYLHVCWYGMGVKCYLT
jgi:hypothetical protein